MSVLLIVVSNNKDKIIDMVENLSQVQEKASDFMKQLDSATSKLGDKISKEIDMIEKRDHERKMANSKSFWGRVVNKLWY